MFTGKIVDRDGEGVAGVTISALWQFPDNDLDPVEIDPTKPDAVDPPMEFELIPLRTFSGTFKPSSAGELPAIIQAWAGARSGRGSPAICKSTESRFRFRLPIGSYTLQYGNGDLASESRASLGRVVKLTEDEQSVELGEIAVTLPYGVNVEGRIVDSEPVDGVEVGQYWKGDGKTLSGWGTLPVDSEGRFSGELALWSDRPVALVAYDREGKRGCIGWLDPKHPEAMELEMQPTVEVFAELVRKGSNEIVEGQSVTVDLLRDDRSHRIMQQRSPDGDYRMPLLPGNYWLMFDGKDLTTKFGRVKVTGQKQRGNFGCVKLTPTKLAQAKGAPAPKLTVTHARGVGTDLDLRQYLGKWVALEFWGHWCGPCVARGIPELMRVHDDYAHLRDRFEILAFHDASVEGLDELDELLKPISESLWNGRELPFPLLLDTTGKTIKRYGIYYYPTLILIDPQGNLAGTDPDGLEKALERYAPEPAAAPQATRTVFLGRVKSLRRRGLDRRRRHHRRAARGDDGTDPGADPHQASGRSGTGAGLAPDAGLADLDVAGGSPVARSLRGDTPRSRPCSSPSTEAARRAPPVDRTAVPV